jgi:hypothetical protein
MQSVRFKQAILMGSSGNLWTILAGTLGRFDAHAPVGPTVRLDTVRTPSGGDTVYVGRDKLEFSGVIPGS